MVLNQIAEEKTYRNYITESLRLRGENKYLTTKYSDLINPPKHDDRTADSVINNIKNGLLKIGS